MMTRAEVIEALQRHARGEGPEVVWIYSPGTSNPCKMRWHAKHGMQYCEDEETDDWVDFLCDEDLAKQCRLRGPQRALRIFLGLWRECAWKDAEKANADGSQLSEHLQAKINTSVEKITRKVVQIGVSGIRNTNTTQAEYVVVALCDDGTIWERFDRGDSPWFPVPPIPSDS